MTPNELSQEIRRIASRIEASEKPSRELVARDLKGLISRLATSEGAAPGENSVAEMVREIKKVTKESTTGKDYITKVLQILQGSKSPSYLKDAIAQATEEIMAEGSSSAK